MRNLQAHSVADVVQSDPGVRVARGFGNFQELYVVRGFPVYSDDMGYNGLYGLLPRQYVAAEFLERVEVFRGANSFLERGRARRQRRRRLIQSRAQARARSGLESPDAGL